MNSLRPIMKNVPALFRQIALLGLGPFILLASGCGTGALDRGLTGPFYQPSNFNLTDRTLPVDVRRIAVLPLAPSRPEVALAVGRDSLQPVLYDELIKTRLFEVITVTEDQMAQWTGKKRWRQDETLPADFIVKIEEQTACDAVLFCELTSFSAYPPLAIGWKFLLVRPDASVIWSFDEIFDAGEPRVSNSVRRFQRESERSRYELLQQADERSGSLWQARVAGTDSVNSPRHFGKYTISAALRTMAAQ